MTKIWKSLKTWTANNMKHLSALVSVLVILLHTSCQKVIAPGELPQQDARIVVNSILISDSFVVAGVSSSKSILSGKAYNYLDNAFCGLYENDVFVKNLVYAGNGNYTSAVLAKPNTKYTLKVAAAGYKDVEGSTTLLGSVSVTGITQYDTTLSNYSVVDYGNNTGGIVGTTKYRLSIIDDLNRKNYYSIRPSILVLDSAGKQIDSKTARFTIYNNIAAGNIFGDNGGNNGTTVDIDDLTIVNGKEIQLDLAVEIAFTSSDYKKIKYVTLFLNIYNLNEDYYKYKTTLNNQTNTGGIFSEPVRVFSNMSSGMGIIAGASVSTFSVYSGSPLHQ